MDADLFLIMSMIIIVTAISFIGINGIVSKILDYKRDKRGIGREARHGETSEVITRRTEMIEDRLRVLERLATDRGALLSDEIEALRDKRREREAS